MRWISRLIFSLAVTIAWLVGLYAPVVGSLPPWSWHGWLTIQLMTIAGNLFGHSLGSSGNAPWQYNAAVVVIYHVPTVLIAFAVYGGLGILFPMSKGTRGETCCRKCGYILRGICEPRCPECGESI